MDNTLVPTPQAEVTVHHLGKKTDADLLSDWLRQYTSPGTQKVYWCDIRTFLAFVQKPLQDIVETDLFDYRDSLAKDADATRNRKLAVVKSLLSYAYRKHHINVNIGTDIRLKQPEDRLTERILSVEQVFAMFAKAEGNKQTDKRNHAILRLLYYSGIRVAELCNLLWRNVQFHLVGDEPCGQVTVYGKGNKTRSILLPKAIYDELLSLRRPEDSEDTPVFKSQKGGGALLPRQVEIIVQKAAERVDSLKGKGVSPHFMRHAHASHSIQGGANVVLVRDTLGHASIATTNKYAHARPTDSSSLVLPL